MLDDGVKQNGSEMRVADVATLLAYALPFAALVTAMDRGMIPENAWNYEIVAV